MSYFKHIAPLLKKNTENFPIHCDAFRHNLRGNGNFQNCSSLLQFFQKSCSAKIKRFQTSLLVSQHTVSRQIQTLAGGCLLILSHNKAALNSSSKTGYATDLLQVYRLRHKNLQQLHLKKHCDRINPDPDYFLTVHLFHLQ